MEVDKPVNFYIDERPFTSVSEGLATVNFPASHDVFYNPVQEFNRDMSVAVLRLHISDVLKIAKFKNDQENKIIQSTSLAKTKEEDFNLVSTNTDIVPCDGKREDGMVILEALAASGLRSIRYAKEVGGVQKIIANDISKQAVECMKTNLHNNSVQHIVSPSLSDASLLMHQHRAMSKRFTAIDLDPYGSPHLFLDAAVQSIADGGLLLVTCTDMAVLCGNSPETCFLKYGALSMKHKACHEMSLRILLRSLESNANKYGRYIVPLLSMSVDFYCRVFVRVFTSQLKCKQSFSKQAYVIQCTSCDSTSFQFLGSIVKNGTSVKYQLAVPSAGPSCMHCGGTHRMGGPIWAGPIHDQGFVSRLRKSLSQGSPLNTSRRMEGTLALIEEELPDAPLYIVFDKLLKVLRLSCFKMKEFVSAILNAGYRVSPTHASRNGLKTDAPFSVLWDILRERERLFPIQREKIPADHPARTILSLNSGSTSAVATANSAFHCTHFDGHSMPVSFELHPDSTFGSMKSKMLRFQMNPKPFWGPKERSVTSLFHGDLQEKSKKNQGSRKKIKRTQEDDLSGMETEPKKENTDPT